MPKLHICFLMNISLFADNAFIDIRLLPITRLAFMIFLDYFIYSLVGCNDWSVLRRSKLRLYIQQSCLSKSNIEVACVIDFFDSRGFLYWYVKTDLWNSIRHSFVILFPVFGTIFVIYNLDSFLSKLYCSNGIFDKLSLCHVKHFHLLIFFLIFLGFSAPRSGDRRANLQRKTIYKRNTTMNWERRRYSCKVAVLTVAHKCTPNSKVHSQF